MKVAVKSGLLFVEEKGGHLTVITVEVADQIARANGLLYAERVASKYDGCRLTLNPQTLVIEKARQAK